jgi:hypothetical protein
MMFKSRLRALVAGMRYAAQRCDEYADQEWHANQPDIKRVTIERALARAYRADADALDKVIDEEDDRAK